VEKNSGAVEFDRRRGKLVSGGGLQVVLWLRWGKDKVSRLVIGEERHDERPTPAMAATASAHNSVAVMGSPIIELRQEDSGRGKRH
jgi:hypothetical protein